MPFSIEYSDAPRIVGGTTVINAGGLTGPVTISSFQDEVAVGGTVFVTDGDDNTVLGTYNGVAADGSVQVTTATGSFYVTNDNPAPGALPTIDTDTAICFGAGTLIATENGAVAVEDLKAGDKVLTADGATTTVRWVGHQTRSTIFGASELVCPVRISAGALAENVPARDLTVTADHGIVFEEAIVHASALVNGSTITRVAKSELGDTVTYYHVETEGHAVVLAENCPAETFIDNVSRERFDNFGEFVAAFGADQDDIAPIDMPRAKGPRQVPAAIKARIADRAVALTGDLAKVG